MKNVFPMKGQIILLSQQKRNAYEIIFSSTDIEFLMNESQIHSENYYDLSVLK